MKDFQAYLLAAGRGRRAGGPKAWRERDGRPLLETQVEFLLGLFPPERIAVSIQAEWLERCRAVHPGVLWTPADPDASPLASLQALARALPLERWAFLYHVDMPVWYDGLFRELAARSADVPGGRAVIPVRGGRGGHPVLLSPALARELAALDPASGRLDELLRAGPAARVEVEYTCVLENWNDP